MPSEKGRSWFYDVLFSEVKPHLSDTMSVWYVRDWIICIPLPDYCSAEPEGISRCVWMVCLFDTVLTQELQKNEQKGSEKDNPSVIVQTETAQIENTCCFLPA